jgi:translation elongation factor EF-G
MAEKYEDPNHIYIQLQQIIENANTIIAELIQGDFMKKDSHTDEEVEKEEQAHFYSPEKGNVAFAAARDNWAFTLQSFAPRIAKQFGMNPNVLKKFLWGKYYYKASEKKIVKTPPSTSS